MKERPILFSAPMVRAILEGRKTQTRRVVTDKHLQVRDHRGKPIAPVTPELMQEQNSVARMLCHFGQVGDQLWVRENFSIIDMTEGYQNEFVSDDFECPMARVKFADGETVTRELICQPDMGIDDVSQARRALKKKTVPSIHMPRWASRIQLEITGVRVERLQDISEDDARAEGIQFEWDGRVPEYTERSEFRELWSSINGRESWDANPWVWVVEFKRVKP